MSKTRPVEQRACIGKTKHETAAMAWQEKKNINCSGKIDVYKCTFCHYWHIGHTNQGVKRK